MRKVFVGVILIVLVAILGAVYLGIPTAVPTTSTTSIPPTTSATTPRIRIDDVTPVGFVLVDEELYWRIKVFGEVDLGEYRGHMFVIITVTLPDMREADLFKPPDYMNITRHLWFSGELVLDAYIPKEWFEKPLLEGEYRVTIWLYKPYKNMTLIFDKSFYLRAVLSISITPKTWASWRENLTVLVTNTGDLPLILEGIGMELPGTGTVIGWVQVPYQKMVVMPGESKSMAATTEILEHFRDELRGKELTVDFLFSFTGLPPRRIQLSIRFPTQ